MKKIVDAKDEGIKEARLTFIVWSRAYQKMAMAKTDPAEWFDISESGTLLMGTACRAAGLSDVTTQLSSPIFSFRSTMLSVVVL